MTPSEIISEVLSDLERPDMASKALAKFYQSLQSAHKVERLRRDLRTVYITNPSINNSRMTFVVTEVTPRSREIRSVNLYSGFSEPTPGQVIPDENKLIYLYQPFIDIADALTATDYYGFKYPTTFSLMGALGTLKGVDTSTTCVEINYLAFPTFVESPVTGEYETDSWIADEFPQLIKAYLKWAIATVIDSQSLIQSAVSEVNFQRREFINTYVSDILPELRNGLRT
jgi:hypothetical protein